MRGCGQAPDLYKQYTAAALAVRLTKVTRQAAQCHWPALSGSNTRLGKHDAKTLRYPEILCQTGT
jgi:hypothetical protein